MSPVKKNDAEQERLAMLEEIGIEERDFGSPRFE
jgi:hypothetical protein